MYHLLFIYLYIHIFNIQKLMCNNYCCHTLVKLQHLLIFNILSFFNSFFFFINFPTYYYTLLTFPLIFYIFISPLLFTLILLSICESAFFSLALRPKDPGPNSCSLVD